MRLKFRQHAKVQMAKRLVTEDDVVFVLTQGELDQGPYFNNIRKNGGRSFDKDIYFADIPGRSDNAVAVVVLLPKTSSGEHEIITVMINYQQDIMNRKMWVQSGLLDDVNSDEIL